LSGAAICGRVLGVVGAAVSVLELAWWSTTENTLKARVRDQQASLDKFTKEVEGARYALRDQVLVRADGTAVADACLTQWFFMREVPANTSAKIKFTFGQNQSFTDTDIIELGAQLNPQGDGVPGVPLPSLKAKMDRNREKKEAQNFEHTETVDFLPLDVPTVVWQLALIGHAAGGPVLFQTKRIARRALGVEPDPVPIGAVREYYELRGQVERI